MREIIEGAGCQLLYLPPHSPDFNPIEKAFAKLKAILRARAERTVEALWDNVGQIVTLFEPQQCQNSDHVDMTPNNLDVFEFWN
ncbi:DDE superfamily endonuclease [Rhizobium sp. PP-WC-1G-195]|nr:DDE superfamily endonuclease [Rhizobium sp. PP-WC-1G-195]TCP73604.1 DDE superfamily endonuclease [Rhizobium sp. PP-CC-2G-626]